MTTFAEILAALPTLHESERAQIRKALDVLNGRAPLAPSQVAPVRIARQELPAEEQRILEALRRFMLRNGAEVVVMSQLPVDNMFRERAAAVLKYMREVSTDRSEQTALLALGFELIRQDMNDHGARLEKVPNAVTARALLGRIHRIPALINRQFPGYAAAGVLHWIFKKDVEDVRKELGETSGFAGRRGAGGK